MLDISSEPPVADDQTLCFSAGVVGAVRIRSNALDFELQRIPIVAWIMNKTLYQHIQLRSTMHYSACSGIALRIGMMFTRAGLLAWTWQPSSNH